ncbi:AmmeMemoRadiSam system protein B [bacterium]|nr:AmmeMemoRadiSam system protein B [bacterium]
MTNFTRPAAVAGSFYPADPAFLQKQLIQLLSEATYKSALVPKAIIVPHAGYIYSGSIASAAYRSIQQHNDTIRKVILFGPGHRVAVHGLAVPRVNQFQTPLGDINLDQKTIRELVDTFTQVSYSDLAHSEEHSIEVQLPFLQTALDKFSLIPLVVGDATEIEVAAVIEHLWGDDETLIVISSDLSHFHNYDKAVRVDTETAEIIESFRGMDLSERSACGRIPISGILLVARKKKMNIQRFDLRNSGDTAGDRQRVVGYGAWGLFQA